MNTALTLGSICLLADLVAAVRYDSEKAFASSWYLIWNLVLCILWILETFLETYALEGKPLTVELCAFWILAIYFFVESVQMLWVKWPVEKHLTASIVDEVINTLVYGYLSVRGTANHSGDVETTLKTDDEEQDKDDSYVRIEEPIGRNC